MNNCKKNNYKSKKENTTNSLYEIECFLNNLNCIKINYKLIKLIKKIIKNK